MEYVRFTELLSCIIDNRGKTCPVAEQGLPLIATNCVKNSNLYPTFEKVRHVTQETYDTWFRGHPLPGDFIFVTKGSPGNVCMTPDPVSFCIAQDMVAVRADPNKIDPLYLFAALRSPYTQFSIRNMHVGTLIPHFKKGDFDKLKLPVPDSQTQKYIGETYFQLSKKIELNQRMNETLEGMARSIFKSWFIDFDPVHAKAEGRKPEGMDPTTAALFPDTFNADGLPEGWELSTIGKNFEIFDSKRIPLSAQERESRKGIYPYYGATSIMDYVNDFIFEGVHILIGEDGSVIKGDGKPFMQYVWGKFWVNNHAHVLKGLNSVCDEHIYLHLLDQNVAPYITGAVQLKINQTNLKRIPFIRATDEVNITFADYIKPLFAKIRANSEQNKTLIALRDTLLPKLISGELRVDTEQFDVKEAI